MLGITDSYLHSSLISAYQAQMCSKNIPDSLPLLILLTLKVHKHISISIPLNLCSHRLAALEEKIVEQTTSNHNIRQCLLALALPAFLQKPPPCPHTAKGILHHLLPVRVHMVEDALFG